nr:InlB B-repeat-containing protein [Bacteroidaceae bacterium]
MKKYILSIIAFALCMLGAKAQDLNVADVTIKAGETKIVNICLNNSQANIVSFQMDMTLPDGITLNKADCELSSRFTDNDQELTIGKQTNGDYRLTSTSFSLKPISGTSGEIIKLSLSASESSQGGTASIKNICMATSNSEKLTPADITFMVNVSYILTYMVDGEEYKSTAIVYDSKITPEAEPTKEGYTFSGWSEMPETMPANDVTVTGSFTVNTYKLTYVVDGEEYKSYDVEYGA